MERAKNLAYNLCCIAYEVSLLRNTERNTVEPLCMFKNNIFYWLNEPTHAMYLWSFPDKWSWGFLSTEKQRWLNSWKLRVFKKGPFLQTSVLDVQVPLVFVRYCFRRAFASINGICGFSQVITRSLFSTAGWIDFPCTSRSLPGSDREFRHPGKFNFLWRYEYTSNT